MRGASFGKRIEMETVLIKVAAFVTIIIVGYFAGRSGILGQRPEQVVSKIVFTFTLPCSVVHAFGSAEFTPSLLLLVPVGLACAVIPYAVAFLATRNSNRRDRVFYLLNICGFNIGCFALPYVQSLFSPEMAVAVCMFDAGNALMMTGGAYALTGILAGKDPVPNPRKFVAKRLFSSLPFDAYLLLIVLAILDIQIPTQVVAFTEPMANANAFCAMLMLGLMIGFDTIGPNIRKIGVILVSRALFSAAFSLLAFAFLPFNITTKIVICILLWAPASAMGPTFTLWCGGDQKLAGLSNGLTIIEGIVVATAIVLLSGALA